MRRGGGLYSSFVASSTNDFESKPYRGAEIPPPSTLTSSGNYPPRGPSVAGPHPTPGLSKQGYSTINAIAVNNPSFSNYGVPIKKTRTEEEYFEDDEGEAAKSEPEMLYQPAPGSPGAQVNDDSEEEDPLDAFMSNLEKEAKNQGVSKALKEIVKPENVEKKKAVRQDIDDADDEEDYYKWMEENPNAGRNAEEDDIDVDYDADGNPIVPIKSKHIDPLPPIDHTKITYKPFEKVFYNEHMDIAGLSPIQVIDLQQKLGIRVSGASPPKPVSSFAHFGFDEELLKAIRKSEFSQPTPIQAQGIPAVMSGRDVIGIAKTGSGKTAAFLWPMMVHIMDQPRLTKGEGPIGLILVPTRELALQIYSEAKKFGKVYGLQVVCAYGGGNRYEQSKAFDAGAEIAIATPGRMIDMIKMKVTNLERVTYLVLDEADKMFDMGFEPQVRSICDHVRPDRQIMLFSATFKKKIEKLTRDALVDPVKIVQGAIGEASEDVTQIVKVMNLGGQKWSWLIEHLVEFTSAGSVLIFVTKIANCEELGHNLKAKEFDCRVIHGDLHQIDRNEIIHAFKKKEFPILVATDVAARGLDIPHIRTVVNFDVARDIDTHTHRVGRTGRAGVKGTAYTFVTEKDKEFVGHIVRNLEAANQEVSKELMDLAMKSSWFRSSRFRKGKFKGSFDNQERPGLGRAQAPSTGSFSSDGYLLATANKSGSGGTSRLTTMKQAFKSQFVSSFRKSDEQSTSSISYMNQRVETPESTMPPPQLPGLPSEMNSMGPPPIPSSDFSLKSKDHSDTGGGDRKRRSRWD